MPQGTNVLLLYASGNHDESAFPHAGNFEMQRQPNHHLACLQNRDNQENWPLCLPCVSNTAW
jgi:hypothetical protein